MVGVGVAAGAEDSTAASMSRAEAAYRRFDERRYGQPDALTRMVDLAPNLHAVATARIPGHAASGTWSPDSEGVARLRMFEADVVWYLGAPALHEPAPVVAALGVWTIVPPRGADGVRAVLTRARTTISTLRRVGDAESASAVLAHARTSTNGVSAAVTRAEHVRHVAALVTGVFARASRGASAAVDEQGTVEPVGASPVRLGAVEVARGAASVGARLLHAKSRDVRTTQRWFLAYHFADGADSSAADEGEPATNVARFTELLPPVDRYWADPFPAFHDGRHYILYEEHLAGVRDAHLAAAELDPVRGLTNPRIILQRPYHLSFPSVFRWNGRWYMTPETMTEGAVQLYTTERFPDAWTYVGDLVTGAGFVDPVVTRVDDRWWMFVGVMPPGAAEATALHLYHAAVPLGPWIAHPLNPTTIDVSVGRPAGRVFRSGGAYYRPVQDGAPHYGHAMNILRIDALTPTAYRETRVGRIEPTWRRGLVGTHTLNAAGRLTMIDALERVPRAHHR